MTLLPEDVISDILERLPVKDLLHFKCVSRRFLNLIESADFVKRHLRRSIQTYTRHNLVLSSEQTRFYNLDLDSGNPQQIVELENPLPEPGHRTAIEGSCNGLLLLRDEREGEIALWNPFTRRFKTLPPCRIPPGRHYSSYGLGYDATTDDYKVVRISYFNDGQENIPVLLMNNDDRPSIMKIWVFGLRSNSWRRVEDFEFSPKFKLPTSTSAVFADGVLYWLFDRMHGGRIFAFDLATESLHEAPMPTFLPKTFHDLFGIWVNKFDHMNWRHLASPNLVVLRGCLFLCLDVLDFLFEFYKRERVGNGWDDFTWTESYKIRYSKPANSTSYVNFLTPLAYSKNGHKLLFDMDDGCCIAWYDLEEQEYETLEIDDLPTSFKSIVCVESLVSPL